MKSKQKRGKDLISGMPDDVLIHILSCLEMVEVVRTCILSSRWKDVWKLVYNFRFHFGHGPEPLKNPTYFMNQVLSLSQSKVIQTFSLTYHGSKFSVDFESKHIRKWVSYAIEHNVRELMLNNFDRDSKLRIRLPPSILSCKSLERLTLYSERFRFGNLDSEVCFPSLKYLSVSLYIHSAENFKAVKHILKLFHCCPVLEELKLCADIDWYYDVVTFEISLPTLKTLDIHVEDDEYEFGSVPNHIVLKTPNLEYLKICEWGTFPVIVMSENSVLSKVILSSDVLYISETVSENEGIETFNFVKGINNTKFLSLSPCVSGVLSCAFGDDFPAFQNLVHLELGIVWRFGWKLLPHFLTSAPNLQVLILERERVDDELEFELDEYVWFDIESVPSCLLLHLKHIEIKSVNGEYDELEVIKYLLEKGKVLERFVVQIVVTNSRRAKLIQKTVLNFPRCSPLCEVEFTTFLCPCSDSESS